MTADSDPNGDQTVTEELALVDHVGRLVVEELHLISQEVQDALDRDHARRLDSLRGILDELDELLARRRPVRVRGAARR